MGHNVGKFVNAKKKKRNLLMITTLQSFFFANTDYNFEKKSINGRL